MLKLKRKQMYVADLINS